MRTLKELYKNEQPVGVYGLTNCVAVLFYRSKDLKSDYVLAMAGIGDSPINYRRKSLEDINPETNLLKYQGIEIPMDEVMRV